MNVTVDADLDITITEVYKNEVGKIEHACNRFDNYYDCNGEDVDAVENWLKTHTGWRTYEYKG